MTQHDKLLKILEDRQWHCSSEFYASFIADPRSRISELKNLDYQLEWRWCQSHNYHDGHSKEWRLISTPPQTAGGRAFLERFGEKPKPAEDNTLF